MIRPPLLNSRPERHQAPEAKEGTRPPPQSHSGDNPSTVRCYVRQESALGHEQSSREEEQLIAKNDSRRIQAFGCRDLHAHPVAGLSCRRKEWRPTGIALWIRAHCGPRR
jgi:hypothetical protein